MTMNEATDLIRRVITRIPIPPGQITLFKALYENPDGLSRTQLAETIRDGDEKSLTGILAALTNRVNGTPGLEAIRPGLQFLIERDASRGGVYYSLRQETRIAIEGLPKLRETMAMPVIEIRAAFKDEKTWLIL